jgi:hypothetical protein
MLFSALSPGGSSAPAAWCSPQRLDFALTFETYPQVALRNTACPLAALMRSVFRRILANLRSCQSGTNTSWDDSQRQ